MDTISRSPKYPQIGLAEAIERIRAVYKKEHRHKADKEVIAKSLGYAGLNGKSLGIMATLKQYMLLETMGDGLRVSDDAVTIIELPQGDPERADSIRRAAFAPTLFSEINDYYGNKLPSDENLRLFLIRKGFNSKAAGIVLRTYRDTMRLVNEEAGDYNGSIVEMSKSQETPMPGQLPLGKSSFEVQRAFASQTASDLYALGVPMPSQGSFSEDLQYRVSEDCKVRVLFEGAVTQEAIKKLVAYLQLGMDDFPSKAQPATLAGADQPKLLTEGSEE